MRYVRLPEVANEARVLEKTTVLAAQFYISVTILSIDDLYLLRKPTKGILSSKDVIINILIFITCNFFFLSLLLLSFFLSLHISISSYFLYLLFYILSSSTLSEVVKCVYLILFSLS